MPKSRNRKRKKKNGKRRKEPKPYEVVKQKYVRIENPIQEDIPFEKKIEILAAIGDQASNDFQDQFKELQSYFQNYDSLYLCAFSAYYFSIQEEGIDEEAIHGHLEFPPFFLEILQCISLMNPRIDTAKPLHEKVEFFRTLVQDLNKNQSARYFSLVRKAKNQEDIFAVRLRTDMMVNTLAVRNWAYVHQMEEIGFELAELIEEDFNSSIGISPKDLLTILFGLVVLTEKKINRHRRKTLSFIKIKTYDAVFDKYEEAFEEVKENSTDQRELIWEKTGKNLKLLKVALLEHSDFYLVDAFTHSPREISDHFSNLYSEEQISIIMDKLSMEFESLAHVNKDFIFLENPVHSKPFIRVSEGSYFSVAAHMFSHLGIEILEEFVSKNKKLKEKYSLKKGKYLEDKVESLFRKSFPKARIFTGSVWKDPESSKVYENDLIMIIEEFAVIVECKSGNVTPPARRGAPERLFKTIENLVVEASEQAIRFENYLKKNIRVHEFETKTGERNIIDNSKVQYYIPLGVTLSNLGSVGCNLKKLIKAQIVPHRLKELAPSINYTDLEIIFDVLELQSEKIHYLSRRREFEAHLNFQGDEMDLFGFYLENGFNIGEAEYEENTFFDFTLESKKLDPYYIGKHRGVHVKKPCLEKSKYWQDLLNMIQKNSENWLVASFILLNLPKEDQIKYETNLKKLSTRIIEGKCTQRHNYMIMMVGPKRRQYTIVAYPYLNTDKVTRNSVMSDIATSIQEDETVRGYVIIGYDLLNLNYPYSVIAGSLATRFFDSLEL